MDLPPQNKISSSKMLISEYKLTFTFSNDIRQTWCWKLNNAWLTILELNAFEHKNLISMLHAHRRKMKDLFSQKATQRTVHIFGEVWYAKLDVEQEPYYDKRNSHQKFVTRYIWMNFLRFRQFHVLNSTTDVKFLPINWSFWNES